MQATLVFAVICGWTHAAEGAPNARLVTQETPMGNAEIQILPATVRASLDGKHMAFVARRNNSWLVATDGVPGKEYDGIGESSLVFSPDGKHLAYAALQGNNWLVVVDGAEEKGYESIRSIVFSPDSRRVSYAANRGRSWFVVVSGAEGPGFDRCRGICFSPNSRRVAYVASRGRNKLVVVDGEPQREFDDIAKNSLTFSPDSKRVAYAANRGRSWLVVVDGAEGKEYDALGVAPASVPADPDAAPAYAALGVNPEVVALEDIIGSARPVFSTDSRCLAYWGRRGSKWLVIVNGLESKPYDGFLRGSNVVFDGPKSLHALAILGNEAFRVKIDILDGQ
jgi:hypothetical protein